MSFITEMENRQKEKITKSRERVKKFGEVYTPGWMVQKMCNMLEDENGGAECWRGTVLEPACGTGNFCHYNLIYI